MELPSWSYRAQAVVLLLATALPAVEVKLPAEPLPQVGQLYVLLGNADDRDELFPAHVGQYAEEAFDDVRAVDFAAPVPQVAHVKASDVRPL